MLGRLDDDTFTESDIDYNLSRSASDHEYEQRVCDITADTPPRCNADPTRLLEGSGSAGKVVFAVRLATFAQENHIKVFYIGTDDSAVLNEIRCHMLNHFKDLPTDAEYLHHWAFDIAKAYGKDTFLVLQYLGYGWLPRLVAFKRRFEDFANRLRFLPSNLSDRVSKASVKFFQTIYPGN